MAAPEVDLSGYKLRGIVLAHSNLSKAKLVDTMLFEADLREANLREADLTGSILRKCDLRSTDLTKAKLVGADIIAADLRGAVLFYADLTDAELIESDLSDTDLRMADLGTANLAGALLVRANLQGADLYAADLKDANLSFADLREANIVMARCKSVDFYQAIYPRGPLPEGWERSGDGRLFPKTTGYPHTSRGALTGPFLKARKSVGEDARSFKRKYPAEAERLSSLTQGRPLRPDILAHVESSTLTRDGKGNPLVWTLTKGKYVGDQTVLASGSDVILFNIDIASLPKEEQEAFFLHHQRVRVGAHPRAPLPLFTVGWVRYLSFPTTILVEEIQSDLKEVKRSTSSEARFVMPYADAFYTDALGTMFQLAEAEGKAVEMLSHEQKREHNAPRSVYEELPRKMGMRKVDRSALPEVRGNVWFYRPNRSRR